ncbi:unnamed protein product [Camellia sinensis]
MLLNYDAIIVDSSDPVDFVEGMVDIIERLMLGAKDYVALFFFFRGLEFFSAVYLRMVNE